MKRFRFSLQSVEDVRVARRDEAERELARIEGEIHNALAMLDKAIEKRVDATKDYIELLTRGTNDPQIVNLKINYIQSLALREKFERERITELQRYQENKRTNVIELSREAEILSKLHEKHRANHEKENARVEQQMLDELAVLAYSNRRKDPA